MGILKFNQSIKFVLAILSRTFLYNVRSYKKYGNFIPSL